MLRLDISQVAQQSGIAPSALRFYEKLGLIASDGRHGLRRQYDDGVLIRLALIALGQRAGYSLDEIGTLFQLKEDNIRLCRRDLRDQATALRQQATELQATADLLDHISSCTAQSHLECPHFQSLIKDMLTGKKGDPIAAAHSPLGL